MIKRGLTLVNAMHITASVFFNEDEHGLHQDYEKWLEGLAPHAPIGQYRHNDTGEDACPEGRDRGLPTASWADAHLKRNVTRSVARDGAPSAAVVVAVTEGRLDFGTWERIFYGEFDGRRRKRVLVKIIGE
jgi:secondary thiamine-phosphate synthase enzyme